MWCAFSSCAPLVLNTPPYAIPPAFPMDRRLQETGTAAASDPWLARDLADARACRKLSDRLESRLRVGVGRFDSARRRSGDQAGQALVGSAATHLSYLNLVGCRIIYRSHLDSAGLPFTISTASLDSAEAVEILQATLAALRSGTSDTGLVDSLAARIPSMLR